MGTAALLEAVAGNAKGTSIVIDDELVIGRHAEGAGRLSGDEEISRTHARVSLDASNCCAIEDLGSTNGTFVNGLRITSPQRLAEGDSIELGATTLVVRELPAQDAPPAPQAGSGGGTLAGDAVPPAPESVLAEAAPAEAEAPTPPAPPEPPPAEPPPAEPEAPSEPAPPEPPPASEPAPLDAAPVEAAAAAAPDAESALAQPADGPAPAGPPANVALQIEVDFQAREVRIALDASSQPLRLRFDDGVWRPVPESNERGTPE